MKRYTKIIINILLIIGNILYYLFITGKGIFDCTWVVLLAMPIWVFLLISEFVGNKRIKIFLQNLGIFGFVFLSVAICLIHIGGRGGLDGNEYQYVVVLGNGFEDGTISKNARLRLDTALQCGDDKQYVVAGGLEDGYTEAYLMKEYLVEHGISEEFIIMEDKSTDTYENLKNAKVLIGDAEIVLVTSRFHLWRSKKIAENVGFNQIQGLAAPGKAEYALYYYMREIGAICREFFVKRI